MSVQVLRQNHLSPLCGLYGRIRLGSLRQVYYTLKLHVIDNKSDTIVDSVTLVEYSTLVIMLAAF